MTSEETIFHAKLGITISDYSIDDQNRLVISGPALEEGVWTGMDGFSRFYSRSVIRDAAPLFNGVPFVCEHRGLKIGEVVQVEPTELGFKMVKAFVTDPASIDAIITKKKTGLSIEGLVAMNPVTGVVTRILRADNISLVTDPACQVCRITDTKFVDKSEDLLAIQNSNRVEATDPGNKIMVDENIIEQPTETNSPIETKPDELVEPVVTDVQPDLPLTDVTKIDVPNTVFDELKLAAEKFKDLRQKLTDMLLFDNKSSVDSIELGAVPVEEPVPEITEQAVETEPVVEEAALSEPEPELQVESEEPIVQAISYEEFEQMKTALSTATGILKEMTDQIEALATQVHTLTEAKIELSAKEDAEKTAIIDQIFEIDANTDRELVTGMTVAQLSAYKSKIETLRKPTAGGGKVSVKRDANDAPVRNPELSRDDLIAGIVSSLRAKQS